MPLFSKFSFLAVNPFLLSLLCTTASVAAEPEEPKGGLDHELLDTSAYPVAPVYVHDNRIDEVVSGDHGRAIVWTEEGERFVPPDTSLALAKGEVFADGVIEVKSCLIEIVDTAEIVDDLQLDRLSARRPPKATVVNLAFESSGPHEDVVLGVLFFNDEGKRSLQVHGLGDIPQRALITERLVLPFAYDSEGSALGYGLLFFSPEGEIVSDGRAQLTSLVSKMFEDFYADVVSGYVAGLGFCDASVSLAHRYPIEMDAAVMVCDDGDVRYFILDVDERGLVANVALESGSLDEAGMACVRSLREWLFLPKVQFGMPVASRVRVPVYSDR